MNQTFLITGTFTYDTDTKSGAISFTAEGDPLPDDPAPLTVPAPTPDDKDS